MNDKLYKFIDVNVDVIESMLQGNLKFTPYLDLNDPNEMFADIDWEDVVNSYRSLTDCGYDDHQFLWLQRQYHLLQKLIPGFVADNFPNNKEEAAQMLRHGDYLNNKIGMQNHHEVIIEHIRKSVGVLSLSSTAESLPMWAHYAENAKGFVVEFRNLQNLFKGDDTGSLNELKEVQYVENLRGMTFDPCTQNRLFFSKHEDWRYENEWRVILPLSKCSQHENGPYIHKIDNQYIASVICGWRCEEENINLVRRAIANHNSQAFLRSSVVVNGQVEVRELPQ